MTAPSDVITKQHVKLVKQCLRDDSQGNDVYREAYDTCVQILDQIQKDAGEQKLTFVDFLLYVNRLNLNQQGDQETPDEHEHSDINETVIQKCLEGSCDGYSAVELTDSSTVKTFALLLGQSSRKLGQVRGILSCMNCGMFFLTPVPPLPYITIQIDTAERCFEWILKSVERRGEEKTKELHAWKGLADTLNQAKARLSSPSDIESGDETIVMSSRRQARIKEALDILAEASKYVAFFILCVYAMIVWDSLVGRGESKFSKYVGYKLKVAEVCNRLGQSEPAAKAMRIALQYCQELPAETVSQIMDASCKTILGFLVQCPENEVSSPSALWRSCPALYFPIRSSALLFQLLDSLLDYKSGSDVVINMDSLLAIVCDNKSGASAGSQPFDVLTAQRLLRGIRKLFEERQDSRWSIDIQSALAMSYFSLLRCVMGLKNEVGGAQKGTGATTFSVAAEEFPNAHRVVQPLVMCIQEQTMEARGFSKATSLLRRENQTLWLHENWMCELATFLGLALVEYDRVKVESLNSWYKLPCEFSTLTHHLACKEPDDGSVGFYPLLEINGRPDAVSPYPLELVTDLLLEACLKRKHVPPLPLPLLRAINKVDSQLRLEDYNTYCEPALLARISIDCLLYILHMSSELENFQSHISFWDVQMIIKFVRCIRQIMWIFAGTTKLYHCEALHSVTVWQQLRRFCPTRLLKYLGIENSGNGLPEVTTTDLLRQGMVYVDRFFMHNDDVRSGGVQSTLAPYRLEITSWIFLALGLSSAIIPEVANFLFSACLQVDVKQGMAEKLSAVRTEGISASEYETYEACLSMISEWAASSSETECLEHYQYYVNLFLEFKKIHTAFREKAGKDSADDVYFMIVHRLVCCGKPDAELPILSRHSVSTTTELQKFVDDISVSTGCPFFEQLRSSRLGCPLLHRMGKLKLNEFRQRNGDRESSQELLKDAQKALLTAASTAVGHSDVYACLGEVFYERMVGTQFQGGLSKQLDALHERAVKLSEKAVKMNPTHAHAVLTLCDVHLLWGDYKKAHTALHDFVSVTEGFCSVWASVRDASLYIHGLRGRESPEKAIIRRSKPTQHEDNENSMTTVNCYAQDQESLHFAADCLQQALRKIPEDWKLWKRLADIYLLLGKLTASQKAIQKCLDLQCPVEESLILEHLEAGTVLSKSAAVEACHSLLNPHKISAPRDYSGKVPDAESLVLAGRIHASSGQHRLALLRYEMGLSLEPQSPSALFGSGFSQLALAKQNLETAVTSAVVDHVKAGIARIYMLLGVASIRTHEGKTFTLSNYRGMSSAWKILGDLYACTFDICPAMYGPDASFITMGIAGEKNDSEFTINLDAAGFATHEMSSPNTDSLDQPCYYVGPRGRICLEICGCLKTSEDLGCGKQSLKFRYPRSSAELSSSYAICATSAYSNAVRTDPQNADYWCDLGRSFWYQAQAIRSALGLSALPLISIDALNPRKQERINVNQYYVRSVAKPLAHKAVNAYAKAIELAPTYARAWNGYGCSVENPLIAQHALVRAIHLGGGGTALCNLGMLYVETGQLQLARDTFLQAQTHDPNNENMWVGHGFVNEAQAILAKLEERIGENNRGMPFSTLDRALSRTAASFSSATELTLSSFTAVPAALYMSHYAEPVVVGSMDPLEMFSTAKKDKHSNRTSSSLLNISCERGPTNALALYSQALNKAAQFRYIESRKWCLAAISRLNHLLDQAIFGQFDTDRHIRSVLEKLRYKMRIFFCWMSMLTCSPDYDEKLLELIKRLQPNSSAEPEERTLFHFTLHSIILYRVSGPGDELAQFLGSAKSTETQYEPSFCGTTAVKLLRERLMNGVGSPNSPNSDERSSLVALATAALSNKRDDVQSISQTLLQSISPRLTCIFAVLASALYLRLDSHVSRALRRSLKCNPQNELFWSQMGLLQLNKYLSEGRKHYAIKLGRNSACAYRNFERLAPRYSGRVETEGEDENENMFALLFHDSSSWNVQEYDALRLSTVASFVHDPQYSHKKALKLLHTCPWQQSVRELTLLECIVAQSSFGSVYQQENYIEYLSARLNIGSSKFVHLPKSSSSPDFIHTVKNDADVTGFEKLTTPEEILIYVHSCLNTVSSEYQNANINKRTCQEIKLKCITAENILKRVPSVRTQLGKADRTSKRSNVEMRRQVLEDCLQSAYNKLNRLSSQYSKNSADSSTHTTAKE